MSLSIKCNETIGQAKGIIVNGCDYGLVSYPLGKVMEIQDVKGRKLYEAVEDITGEYLDFFDHNSEFVMQSPHIGNFEGVEDCVVWFLSVGEY